MNITEFSARVFEAAREAGIAPAEITYTSSDRFNVRVREGKLENYQVSESMGLTLRGRVNGRIGTASTQALDEESVALLVEGVRESAALIETDEQDDILPPDERYDTVCNFSGDVSRITAEQKIALALDIDKRLQQADPRLKPDDTVVSTSSGCICIKNTLGLDLSHDSNVIYAYANALAKEGDRAATGFKLLWGYSLDDVHADAIADGCVQEALSKLHAERMVSGAYPVVIRSNAMADLLTTFSGIFSADNTQKGLSLLGGKEGQAIASPCLTLIDDPLMAWGLGSCPFDCEGSATRTKCVIENGVLRTLLHNRKTAKKAGIVTTGNAAGSGSVAPSNLYVKSGMLTAEELLENMGNGLYLTEVSGLHAGANPVSGDFSLLARGFEIKGGKPVRAVEQFTVAGNFYQLLRDIQSVGSDLLFEGSPIGSPSVRVKALSVAGENR